MEDISTLSILGIYVLLIFCMISFFMIGVKVHRIGKKIALFESAHKKQAERMKESVKRSIETIEKLTK